MTVVEKWLAVVGYEGLYEVSDLGRVRSLTYGKRWPGPRKEPRLLKCTPVGPESYPRASLVKDGIETPTYVHDLVLTAFVGIRPDGLLCRHYDGNPQNNTLGNLLWGTYEANSRDTMRHGRWTQPISQLGEEHHSAKITEDGVRAIRAEPHFRGVLQMLANAFDVKASTIWMIRAGKTWKHVAQ